MKGRKADDWLPLWCDKWLWGSTRIELEPDERAVWVDFLVLASKDNGWIRANEGIAYPDEQLAGMLRISVELLQRAKAKFVEYGKIKIHKDSTVEVLNWNKYQLTDRRKRDLKHKK